VRKCPDKFTVAQELAERAIKESKDNVTVLVVWLHWGLPPQSLARLVQMNQEAPQLPPLARIGKRGRAQSALQLEPIATVEDEKEKDKERKKKGVPKEEKEQERESSPGTGAAPETGADAAFEGPEAKRLSSDGTSTSTDELPFLSSSAPASPSLLDGVLRSRSERRRSDGAQADAALRLSSPGDKKKEEKKKKIVVTGGPKEAH